VCTRERGCVSELCTPKLGPNAGDGKRGKKQFQAPLADPYAEPNELLVPAVDDTLRGVVAALLGEPPPPPVNFEEPFSNPCCILRTRIETPF
jgi:hypothetical protein